MAKKINRILNNNLTKFKSVQLNPRKRMDMIPWLSLSSIRQWKLTPIK